MIQPPKQHPPKSFKEWRAFYKAMGYCTAVQIGILLLPASKNGILAHVFGIPFDASLKWHRWSGLLVPVMFLGHWFGFVIYFLGSQKNSVTLLRKWVMIGVSGVLNLETYMGIFGSVAVGLFLLVILSALEPVRRKFYDYFHYTHMLVFPAIFFAAMHDSFVLYVTFPSVLLYLIDFLYRIYNRRHPHHITSLRREPSGYIRLEISGFERAFRGGQWVRVNVPRVSGLQWHPFSICNTPGAVVDAMQGMEMKAVDNLSEVRKGEGSFHTLQTEDVVVNLQPRGLTSKPNAFGEEVLTFLIKPQGGKKSWTRRLEAEWKRHLETEGDEFQVYVEGPFGRLPPTFRQSDIAVLFAGGSGISAALGVARDLLDQGEMPVHLNWTARESNIEETSLYKELLAHPKAWLLLKTELTITSLHARMDAEGENLIYRSNAFT
ncbi:ferric/cupric-chelate reductase [Borealophlyctis nickersoniae]|nr:ferric/cupric-chelate reductase [Borealophlyctis nickersoniae]